ncbi:uncharacterized protein BCR38DRAFT_311666, partial [Pseudomassariella vexata]
SDENYDSLGLAVGAVLTQWKIAQLSQGSAAMWDAHLRVGGAAGTDLPVDDC